MKSFMCWCIFYVLTIVFNLSFSSEAGAKEGISLKQAIEIALKESPLLKSRSSEVRATKAMLGAAKGALLPRIDAYTSYFRFSDPQVVVPIKSFHGAIPEFSRDQYRVGIGIKIPIFVGGRLRTQVDLSEISALISREQLNLTREQLIYNITNVYNEILFLKGLGEAQNETLMALKRLLDDSRSKLKVGRLAPVDVMRVETQVMAQEEALISTRQGILKGLYTLSQLIGRDPGEIEDVVGALEDDLYEPEIQGDWDSLVENRPDVQIALREVRLAEKKVRLEKGLNLPTIDIVGDYGRRAGGGFEGSEEVWSAGINLGLNIFSGGVISARIREAKERVIAARERLRHTRLLAKREIKSAIASITEAKKRVEAAKAALKSAKESYRIEELKYQAGAGTVTDTLLAQSAWLQARANVLRALFDLKRARADLALSTGTI
ncbi:Outer membrane protein [Dissulfuribacter thermophilus]|uniref:Outer membrane protein n=1 Tax=Dissulfuribacter thermophilus TaxID=1156395 RepID=A0A1B9F838_9BACT|nr:TolC family protein [Dissulfuribacter thermophilus]OCC16014.1 Outer membrane protein [Dissulfuribacter thermophilus]